MDLSELNKLKRMVSFDARLAPVFKYSRTNFAEKPGFVKLGERVYRHPVEPLIETVGNDLHADPGPINKLALIRIPEHHFVHGSFFGSPDDKNVRPSDAKKRKPGDPHHN